MIPRYLPQPPCSPVSVIGGIRLESQLLTQAQGPGRLSALCWTEMAWVLVAAFCLLSGACAQYWSVTLAPGSVERWAGSCVTIPCSFTYPTGWTVSAVIWTREGDQTVYHSDEARVHADFKGRARYLGDLQHNCSLRVVGLRPSDQGTYHFRFEAAGDGRSDAWTGRTGQRLNVSDDRCQASLGRRLEPGPSLTCSVGAACPHHPSWYDRDGARRSPEQTPGRAGVTELQISPSQLGPGTALRCQVDGYRDECDSAQAQPLGTVAPNVPMVEVSWPAGKAVLREGDNFTLRCQAAALRPVAGYVWSRGDVWLPEAGQDLRVRKAAVSDGGSYACGVWVSGPGWGYLSLSARESVEVQLPGTPTYIIGLTVVLVLLLLVGLVGITAWSKMRRKHQGMSSNAPAEEHGKSTTGDAEFSHKPETESPYEELQGRTQDIYNELVLPQAGSR
ncbi:sialic acid-binding Ig-like lectin 12 [Mauremys reevesii]|uniref:sialic acid-binding Ig-like lectin 12 n=1 Tax=Mauremys reevesii TaxID=260615 RepID=UPI00193F80DF|nr:sialic acid-binding Ig-like lectin 12 [Mauremys reevesii]